MEVRSQRITFQCTSGSVDVWMTLPSQNDYTYRPYVVGDTLYAQLFASRNLGIPFKKIAYQVQELRVNDCTIYAQREDLYDDCMDRNEFWELLPGLQNFNIAYGFVQ
ncbi:MAG: hypothetical protein AB2A00_38430 [Myxococcota bacterium]